MTTITVPAPDDDIEAAWGEAVADALNSLLGGTSFTPGLTNIAVGTGGTPTNAAYYKFTGGPAVGDLGVLSLHGKIKLGTSGFSVGTGPQVTLPLGFALVNSGSEYANVPGSVRCFDASPAAWSAIGCCTRQSSTKLGLELYSPATYVTMTGITATVPITWAANDEIWWTAIVNAVRT